MNYMDIETTIEELSKAVTKIASWKAPGSDGILTHLFRQCKCCLLPLIHDILVKCWREVEVPQDMCDAKIILYKNKGAWYDYNNHRGIFLLDIAGKLFARVFLHSSWPK